MGVRGIGLQPLLSIPVTGKGPKALADQHLAELRGLSPLEFAKRGIVERALHGTSALKLRLSRTEMDDLGGGVREMTEAVVAVRANTKITIVGMEPLSELLRVGRR